MTKRGVEMAAQLRFALQARTRVLISEESERGNAMQQSIAVITNGVDVTRIQETIDAVKASPEAGNFRFRIQNRWVNGGQNLSEVGSFTAGGQLMRHKTKMVLTADEPEALLGEDSAA